MKHRVSELEGALLDAAVAHAIGYRWQIQELRTADMRSKFDACLIANGVMGNDRRVTDHVVFCPSREWKEGGPIIQREQISITSPDDQLNLAWRNVWSARVLGTLSGDCNAAEQHGAAPLIAAMRVLVASKFGEEIELP